MDSERSVKDNRTKNEGTILKMTGLQIPDPEVKERAHRRRFTQSYKLVILCEVDRCTKWGELGALLRREGLYHSNLQKWRRQRDQGELDGLEEKRRGPKPKLPNPLSNENRKLKRENERLRAELKKARLIIDVQKKISDLLGIDQPPIDLDETP